MVDIGGYDITVISDTGDEVNDHAVNAFYNFYLEKMKAQLTEELMQRKRNLLIYGTTHPERLQEDVIDG